MEHYGSVQGFKEYHIKRNNEVPATLDDDEILSALIVASEWIDNNYGNLFVGWKTGGFLQDRQWPRISATIVQKMNVYTFPKDAIPFQVEYAVYEAALRQAVAPGSLSVDYTPGKYKKVAIEGAVSVEYAGFAFASDAQTVYPIIDMWLSVLLDPSAAGNFSVYSGATTRV